MYMPFEYIVRGQRFVEQQPQKVMVRPGVVHNGQRNAKTGNANIPFAGYAQIFQRQRDLDIERQPSGGTPTRLRAWKGYGGGITRDIQDSRCLIAPTFGKFLREAEEFLE